jgi:hypothetical protein
MKWQGVSGARNPSLLFDTPTNLTNGGGSLQLGTDELRKEFTTANPNLDSANPAIQSSDDLLAAFKNALNRYNHGSTNDSPPYGSGVLSDSLPYTPVLQSTIFKH